jgi:hypothetical protein
MTARGGGPTPTELRNMGPRGVPNYPLGIAERRHRSLPSLAKERNPDVSHYQIAVKIKPLYLTHYVRLLLNLVSDF